VGWREDANQLAEEIASGENGERLQLLTESVLRGVFWVRKHYGFVHVPTEAIRKDLAEEAVRLAVAKAKASGRTFMEMLTNAARDVFREYSKIVRAQNLELLSDAIEDPGLVYDDSRELCKIVTQALRDEPESCQTIVMMRQRDATYPEIALATGSDPESCRNEYMANLRSMVRTITDRYPELVEGILKRIT